MKLVLTTMEAAMLVGIAARHDSDDPDLSDHARSLVLRCRAAMDSGNLTLVVVNG